MQARASPASIRVAAGIEASCSQAPASEQSATPLRHVLCAQEPTGRDPRPSGHLGSSRGPIESGESLRGL